MEALTELSTPNNIYALCSSYQQLSRHKQHAPVRALIRAITSYRHKHKDLVTAELAFTQHRARTLDGRHSPCAPSPAFHHTQVRGVPYRCRRPPPTALSS